MSAPLNLEARWVVTSNASGSLLTAAVSLHEPGRRDQIWNPRGLDTGRQAYFARCAAVLLGVRVDDLEFIDSVNGEGRTYRSTVAAHVGWTRVVVP